jgi:hypothetical protein
MLVLALLPRPPLLLLALLLLLVLPPLLPHLLLLPLLRLMLPPVLVLVVVLSLVVVMVLVATLLALLRVSFGHWVIGLSPIAPITRTSLSQPTHQPLAPPLQTARALMWKLPVSNASIAESTI